MTSNFNQQFVMLDFKLLENKSFLEFIGSAEFATYLVLRRYIWRSAEPHYMGLHDLYLQQKKLVCSLEREKIAEFIDIAPDNISRHLSRLQNKGVIKRIITGRQNVFVLGEWIDVNGDASYKVEWFYMEGEFGINKPDLTQNVRPDLTQLSSDQNQPKASDNNKQINKEEKQQQSAVVALLREWKVADKKARQLADKHQAKYIREKVGLLQWKLEHPSQDKPVMNPTAWLIQAIEQDYQLPEEFARKQHRKREDLEFDEERGVYIVAEAEYRGAA